ncbi:hypothetical protein M501DRAFT_1057677 [Patellaria atrata CBS 101060]|uniref:F-box domain-containing protein n=1 Tax=Patellaria atrata CBS 101060 TaxID=1346257 RepID=A0A9P4SBK1_9PEZI|nr:hypothetical protein M501DRAFT_1057677 [Patellaria atrata CBS 101060]
MPSTLTAKELEELGKSYYKRKEYQKAVDTFTEGLRAPSATWLTLLDYRSAAYMKLEKNERALADGKEMIRVGNQDVRGYLRAGKVLQKMEKFETALKVYEYGLRKVSTANTDYQLLRGVQDKLTKQLSPPKAVDPLNALPAELVDMVLSYLSFKNIVNCLRVSRTWNGYLGSIPSLWSNLDLSLPRKPVKLQFIRKCITRSQGRLSTAVMSRIADGGTLNTLTKCCKNLQTLELTDGGLVGQTLIEAMKHASNLTTLILGQRIHVSEDTLYQILKNCPSLVHVEVQSLKGPLDVDFHMPNMQTIKLTSAAPGRQSIDSFLDYMPNIRCLSLINWSLWGPRHVIDLAKLSKLQHLNLEKSSSLYSLTLPPSLLSLKHTKSNEFVASNNSRWSPAQADEPFLLPQIEELHLEQVYAERAYEVLDTMLNAEERPEAPFPWSSLRTLALCSFTGSTERESDISIALGCPRLEKLEELALIDTPTVDDELASTLPDLFPRLRILNLSKTSISGVAVKVIVTKLRGRLTFLGLNMCHRVSPDAVEWARQQGIEVSFKSAEGAGRGKGGRLVRF